MDYTIPLATSHVMRLHLLSIGVLYFAVRAEVGPTAVRMQITAMPVGYAIDYTIPLCLKWTCVSLLNLETTAP